MARDSASEAKAARERRIAQEAERVKREMDAIARRQTKPVVIPFKERRAESQRRYCATERGKLIMRICRTKAALKKIDAIHARRLAVLTARLEDALAKWDRLVEGRRT